MTLAADETLFDVVIPLVPFVVILATALYAVARKSWKTDDTVKDLVDIVQGKGEQTGLMCLVNDIGVRLTVLETRFDPFLRIIDDSLSRMIIGAKMGNPIDPLLLRKIKVGLASLEEIEAFDLALIKDIEQNGSDALALVVVRYWVALKKAEVQSQRKS